MKEVHRYTGNIYYKGFGPIKQGVGVVLESDYDDLLSEVGQLVELLRMAYLYEGVTDEKCQRIEDLICSSVQLGEEQ